MIREQAVGEAFSSWAVDAEPRLRHSLTAAFGVEIGKEATAEALAFAWEHWERVSVMENPVGYVFATGRNKGRRMTRRQPRFLPVPAETLPWVEPGLPKALAKLSQRQRTVVALLHGYQWTMSEVADLLSISKTTVQNHAERGIQKLRRSLGVR